MYFEQSGQQTDRQKDGQMDRQTTQDLHFKHAFKNAQQEDTINKISSSNDEKIMPVYIC